MLTVWLVGELEIEHAHVPRGGSFGGLDTPEFRAMNPHGKVPVIDDSGVVVWESHAILRYLAAQCARRPRGRAHRGLADRDGSGGRLRREHPGQR